MRNSHRTLSYALPFICAFLMIAAPASAAPNTLIGSWIATPDDGGSPTLFTFNLDRTLTAAAGDAGTSAGHGVWKRTGFKTYRAKNTAFAFGPTGEAELLLTARLDLEIQPGGETATADIEITISLLDGTVLEVLATTGTATRITLD